MKVFRRDENGNLIWAGDCQVELQLPCAVSRYEFAVAPPLLAFASRLDALERAERKSIVVRYFTAEMVEVGGGAPFAAVVLNPSDDPTHLPKWDPCDPEIGP